MICIKMCKNGINFVVPRKILHGFEEIGVKYPDLTPSKHLGNFQSHFFCRKNGIIIIIMILKKGIPLSPVALFSDTIVY